MSRTWGFGRCVGGILGVWVEGGMGVGFSWFVYLARLEESELRVELDRW